jgi:hypothetical protein
MKRNIFTFTIVGILGLFASVQNANAQRLQIIHNAAAVAFDTVDVYIDDSLYCDNIAFRSATQLIRLTAGSHVVNVNTKTSIDSGDLVLGRFEITLAGTQVNIAMITGVDMPANYDVNPDGVSTDLQLVFKNNVNVSPLNAQQTALNFIHGTSDMAGIDIYSRLNTSLANNLRYNDAAVSNTLVSSVATLIDIRDTNAVNVINTYAAPFNSYAKKSLVLFTSGFANPMTNQSGMPFGLFAVDTNGGTAIALQPVSRVQFIHNSPDTTIETVDVWLNNTKVADNLMFRKATSMITANAGTYDITIAKNTSTDSSSATSLLKVAGVQLDGGKTYLGITAGVADTNQFAVNPDGIDRRLALIFNNYKESNNASQLEYSFFNGTPDAAQLDLNRILPGLTKVGDDIAFKSLSTSVLVPAGNTTFNLTSSDSATILGVYNINSTAFNGRTASIFTSGVMNATGNPTSTKANGLFVAYSDGTVAELALLTGEFQIVHNSADVTLDSVDVYINGELAYDNLAFRTATPFIKKGALITYSIAIAPQTSVSVAEAFFTKALTLEATNYYVVASGLLIPNLYTANPNGKNTSFNLATYKGARKTALSSKNIELMYYHGSTDLQTTTCRGDGQVQFLSKNDSYGAFHSYSAHTALDNINMDLKDAVTDSTLYKGFANLASYQGQAGLVFTSGFYNDTLNQDGDTLVMFVVWPDGNVDSIAPAKVITGIKENIFSNAQVSVFPNPANSNFTISLNALKASDIKVSLYDITGKSVYTKNETVHTGINNIGINTSNIESGIYFVTLTSSQESLTRKVSIVK